MADTLRREAAAANIPHHHATGAREAVRMTAIVLWTSDTRVAGVPWPNDRYIKPLIMPYVYTQHNFE